MRYLALALAAQFLLGHPAAAQSSASFKLDEHTFNAGGDPAAGVVPASASFRITLDSVGDAVSAAGLGSPSFNMDGGPVPAYPPPGEVTGLRFPVGKQGLWWDAEKSAGTYNLYRALLTNLAGGGFGKCEQQDITGETTLVAEVPPVNDGYFYLVTVRNRLAEEGTKGFMGDMTTERTGNVCP